MPPESIRIPAQWPGCGGMTPEVKVIGWLAVPSATSVPPSLTSMPPCMADQSGANCTSTPGWMTRVALGWMVIQA